MEILAQDVKDHPDAYQCERAKRLGVSTQGINHALRRLGVTYKKTLRHPRASAEERHIFSAWVTQHLLPKLPPACVIVMDNATFHQRQDIKTALANAGHTRLNTCRLILQTSMTLNQDGPNPKQSEKRKNAPSSSSLPPMHYESFYMGSAIGYE